MKLFKTTNRKLADKLVEAGFECTIVTAEAFEQVIEVYVFEKTRKLLAVVYTK